MKLGTLTRALAIAQPLTPAAEHPIAAPAGPVRPVPADDRYPPTGLARLSLMRIAAPAFREARPSLRGLSFAALVVMPIAVVAAYYLGIIALTPSTNCV